MLGFQRYRTLCIYLPFLQISCAGCGKWAVLSHPLRWRIIRRDTACVKNQVNMQTTANKVQLVVNPRAFGVKLIPQVILATCP